MDQQGQQQQAQEGAQANLAATLPDPPPFWHDFLPEKLARFDAISKAHVAQTGNGANGIAPRILNLPEDLINLQPPAEPADGVWRVFGDRYTLEDELPTLEEQGITRLGPSPTTATAAPTAQGRSNNIGGSTHDDLAFELKRLAKSLLLNFLELAGVMGINPAQAEEKIDDLRVLFINMHHTLNEFRPHQARESLITEIQGQLDRIRGETAAIRAVTDKARRDLEGLGSLEVPGEDEMGGDTTRDGARDAKGDDGAYWERENGIWASIDDSELA